MEIMFCYPQGKDRQVGMFPLDPQLSDGAWAGGARRGRVRARALRGVKIAAEIYFAIASRSKRGILCVIAP